MPSSSTQSEFTIRSANQTLPLVKMIVEDIVQFANKIGETRDRLDYLNEGRDLSNPKDEYSKEVKAIYDAMDQESKKMDLCLKELADLKVNPANAANGFVDFPAIRDEEMVMLCWNVADKEVLHWHKSEEDCCKRRPIDLALIRQSGDTSVSAP